MYPSDEWPKLIIRKVKVRALWIESCYRDSVPRRFDRISNTTIRLTKGESQFLGKDSEDNG